MDSGSDVYVGEILGIAGPAVVQAGSVTARGAYLAQLTISFDCSSYLGDQGECGRVRT